MFDIIATQHCEAITPFSSGYKLNSTNGITNTFLIGTTDNLDTAYEIIKDTLVVRFDGEYDEASDCVYVNEECVYTSNRNECIVDGIHIFIVRRIDNKYQTAWVELKNPIGEVFENFRVCSKGYYLNVDGLYLKNLDSFDLFDLMKDIIGRKVFWLDPCALRGDEHTSGWREITEIDGDIVFLDNDTEVFINECYI